MDFFESLDQAKPLMPTVPNVPVLLMTNPLTSLPGWSAETTARYLAADRKAEQRFLDELPQAELHRVDTDHYIQNLEPQLVIDDVQRMLDKAH